MILKITNPRDGSITILKVSMIDFEEGAASIKIWDSFNTSAIVYMEDSKSVLSCANNLYENGRSQTYGTIIWSTTK